MRTIIGILTLAALMTSGAAVSQGQLEDLKDDYNNQTDRVPGFLGDIIGGETVNVEINRSDELDTTGAKMDGLEIQEIRNKSYADNTMVVETDGETLDAVLSSDSPFERVEEEIEDDDIEYRSTTTGGKVKLTVFRGLKGLAEAVGFQF